MLGSAVTFATMSACARGLHGYCDWRVVAVVRATLAFVFTLAIARTVRVPLVWPGPKTLWVRSLVGCAGMLCTFFALAHLPVSRSVTLLNSFPLWVAILSWPVLGIRPTWAVAGAVMCGLLGVNLLAHGEATGSAGWGAVLAALAASVSTAVVMLGLHRLRKLHPLAIAVHFAAVSSVVVVLAVVVTSLSGSQLDPFELSTARPWLLLAGVGVCATLGQILMTSAFRYGPPDRLAPVGLSQSAFALIYDLVFWNHPLDATLLGGMALVLLPGVWLVLHPGRSHADS
jgi:drug/metabolite transporter (DMT)-like permease